MNKMTVFTLHVSVLAWPGLPPGSTLAALGVRRLSGGSALSKAVFGSTASLAAAFLASEDSGPLAAGGMTYADINALMATR